MQLWLRVNNALKCQGARFKGINIFKEPIFLRPPTPPKMKKSRVSSVLCGLVCFFWDYGSLWIARFQRAALTSRLRPHFAAAFSAFKRLSRSVSFAGTSCGNIDYFLKHSSTFFFLPLGIICSPDFIALTQIAGDDVAVGSNQCVLHGCDVTGLTLCIYGESGEAARRGLGGSIVVTGTHQLVNLGHMFYLAKPSAAAARLRHRVSSVMFTISSQPVSRPCGNDA